MNIAALIKSRLSAKNKIRCEPRNYSLSVLNQPKSNQNKINQISGWPAPGDGPRSDDGLYPQRRHADKSRRVSKLTVSLRNDIEVLSQGNDILCADCRHRRQSWRFGMTTPRIWDEGRGVFMEYCTGI